MAMNKPVRNLSSLVYLLSSLVFRKMRTIQIFILTTHIRIMPLCRALLLICGLIFFGLAITSPVIAEENVPLVCHTLPDTTQSDSFYIMLPEGWVTFPMEGYDGLTGIVDPNRSNITYMVKIIENPTGATLDATLLQTYLDAIAFRDGIEIATDSIEIYDDDSLYAYGTRNDRSVSVSLGSTPSDCYELYSYYDDLTALLQDNQTVQEMAGYIGQNLK